MRGGRRGKDGTTVGVIFVKPDRVECHGATIGGGVTTCGEADNDDDGECKERLAAEGAFKGERDRGGEDEVRCGPCGREPLTEARTGAVSIGLLICSLSCLSMDPLSLECLVVFSSDFLLLNSCSPQSLSSSTFVTPPFNTSLTYAKDSNASRFFNCMVLSLSGSLILSSS